MLHSEYGSVPTTSTSGTTVPIVTQHPNTGSDVGAPLIIGGSLAIAGVLVGVSVLRKLRVTR